MAKKKKSFLDITNRENDIVYAPKQSKPYLVRTGSTSKSGYYFKPTQKTYKTPGGSYVVPVYNNWLNKEGGTQNFINNRINESTKADLKYWNNAATQSIKELGYNGYMYVNSPEYQKFSSALEKESAKQAQRLTQLIKEKGTAGYDIYSKELKGLLPKTDMGALS